MKILQYAPNYIPATRYGGPIQSSHGLAKALASRGHDVHVFTTNVDGAGVLDVPLDRVVRIDGVNVRYFPVTAPRRIYYAPAMSRALAEQMPAFDVAHINGMYLWPGARTALIAKRAGVPTVISPRGMLDPELTAGKSAIAKRIWIRLLEQPALKSAAAIHVTSQEEAAGIRRAGLDLAPIELIGNGVERPSRMPAARDIEHIWSGIASGSRIAFLGRLDSTKGLDLAIDAVLAHPHAQILIAGVDQLGPRAALEPRLTAASGVTRGRFIGEVKGSDKWALLAGADLLVVPSIKESFGMSAAEALAIETPVLCTEGVGLSPLVRSIDEAFVPERKSAAIAAALALLLADPNRRHAFGRRAANIMATEYTWDAIAAQMESLYARVAHVAPARHGRAA